MHPSSKLQVLSVNVGLPRAVVWKGRTVVTGIFKRFLQSGLTGFYFAVLKEGEVAAGDPIRLLHRDEHQVTVAEITRLYRQDKHNLDLLRRAVALEALPTSWRDYFLERLISTGGLTTT